MGDDKETDSDCRQNAVWRLTVVSVFIVVCCVASLVLFLRLNNKAREKKVWGKGLLKSMKEEKATTMILLLTGLVMPVEGVLRIVNRWLRGRDGDSHLETGLLFADAVFAFLNWGMLYSLTTWQLATVFRGSAYKVKQATFLRLHLAIAVCLSLLFSFTVVNSTKLSRSKTGSYVLVIMALTAVVVVVAVFVCISCIFNSRLIALVGLTESRRRRVPTSVVSMHNVSQKTSASVESVDVFATAAAKPATDVKTPDDIGSKLRKQLVSRDSTIDNTPTATETVSEFTDIGTRPMSESAATGIRIFAPIVEENDDDEDDDDPDDDGLVDRPKKRKQEYRTDYGRIGGSSIVSSKSRSPRTLSRSPRLKLAPLNIDSNDDEKGPPKLPRAESYSVTGSRAVSSLHSAMSSMRKSIVTLTKIEIEALSPRNSIRNFDPNLQTFLMAAAKQSVLCSWLVFSLLLAFGALYAWSVSNCMATMAMVGHALASCSMLTVSICAFLTHKYSRDDYEIVCAPCDRWCRRLASYRAEAAQEASASSVSNKFTATPVS